MTNDRNLTRLQKAVTLARHGFPLILLHGITNGRCTCRQVKCGSPGKHPLFNGWQKLATKSICHLQEMLNRNRDANFGALTGGGRIVLDVDPRHGGDDSIRDLELKFGILRNTVTVLTGGGGTHYYFSVPQEFRNAVGFLPGLDIRGNGGFVVAPGSRHILGGSYEFDATCHPDDGVPFSDIPTWLPMLIKTSGTSAKSDPSMCDDFAKNVHEGGRNNRIARLAGYLFRRSVNSLVATEILQIWNKTRCIPPMGEAEVDAVIRSIFGREIARRKKEERA